MHTEPYSADVRREPPLKGKKCAVLLATQALAFLCCCVQETGEFDAFNTIMAILRMRKKYPDAKPEEFFDLDADFRDFVNCKPCESSLHLHHCVAQCEWLWGRRWRGWNGWWGVAHHSVLH